MTDNRAEPCKFNKTPKFHVERKRLRSPASPACLRADVAVKTFGASREAIAAAIEKVGANPATVCKELARETIDDQETRRAEAK